MVVMLPASFSSTIRESGNQSLSFLFLTLFVVFLTPFCSICVHYHSNSNFLCLKTYNVCEKVVSLQRFPKEGNPKTSGITSNKRVGQTNFI